MQVLDAWVDDLFPILGSFLPNLNFLILKSLSTVGHSAVHVHDVVTDWSYALAEFLVSSLFVAILVTFTLQMFFKFMIPFLFSVQKYYTLQ